MIGPNCDLSARADTGTFGLNDTLNICNSTPPPGGYPAGWTEVTSGCCYGVCESYTAEAFVGPPTDWGYAAGILY